MRVTAIVVLTCIAFVSHAYAQNTGSVKNKKEKDSSEMFMMDMDFDDRKPMVSLFYGSGSPTRDGLTGTVENTMTFGGSLGMENEKTWWRDPSIVRRYANTLYLWYGQGADEQGVTTAMSGDNPAVAATTSMNLFRIGVADESGFGYKLGESSNLTLLVSNAPLSWTSVTPQAVLADSASAQAVRDFEGSLRFGEAMRPGISWRIAEPISLRVGYEWSQIYPRHMFWYWALSQTIEAIADGAATYLAREIGKSSPVAMPIMYFLLKNGVAAGFKALRMNQMNWPFTTVAPMNVHMWNIGAAVHF